MSSWWSPAAACLCVVVVVTRVAGQTEKVVVLENADSLVGRVIDGNDARELIGHVRIRQENVVITCDRALQYVKAGTINLSGNVVVRDDSVVITAPRAIYHRDDRRAEAFDDVQLDDGKGLLRSQYGEYAMEPAVAFFRGDVVVRDSASVITADSLTYERRTQLSVARGRVRVVNLSDGVTIAGGHLVNDPRERTSRMTVHPVLVQIDSSGAARRDTLVIRCREMESFRDSTRRFVARDSVRINRAELAATAELAVFHTDADSIVLRGTPVIWYGRTQVMGDSVNVYLQARELRKVSVLGNAVAVSQSDTLFPERFDQLTGEVLELHFERKVLAGVVAETRAISVYHLYEDSLGNGLNRSSGDRIVLEFAEGKISAIRIIGGVEGQYFPEPLVRAREREYRIPGFFWREDRPRVESSELPWHRNRATSN